jgi:hypothetical protein
MRWIYRTTESETYDPQPGVLLDCSTTLQSSILFVLRSIDRTWELLLQGFHLMRQHIPQQ